MAGEQIGVLCDGTRPVVRRGVIVILRREGLVRVGSSLV
jgi:hypothetical protein